MNNSIKTILPILLIVFTTLSLSAQPPGGGQGGRPGGGPGGGFDPDEMIKREKQNIYEQITDLSDDQKLLLEGIYEEFGTTINETATEMRGSGNREGMRTKMRAIRQEKDALVKDVLNESQFELYAKITAPRDRKRTPVADEETNPE
jgi:hypothetical protein